MNSNARLPAEFCEETKDLDPHDLCITMLAMQAE